MKIISNRPQTPKPASQFSLSYFGRPPEQFGRSQCKWGPSMLHSNMLPNDRTRALLDSVAPREQAGENGIGESVNFALGFLRRQYWVIIFTAVLALAASAIYLRITPPVYTARAKVLFGNPKAQFVQQQSMLAADTPVDSLQLESQIQILKSKAIATLVINQLNP